MSCVAILRLGHFLLHYCYPIPGIIGEQIKRAQLQKINYNSMLYDSMYVHMHMGHLNFTMTMAFAVWRKVRECVNAL